MKLFKKMVDLYSILCVNSSMERGNNMAEMIRESKNKKEVNSEVTD